MRTMCVVGSVSFMLLLSSVSAPASPTVSPPQPTWAQFWHALKVDPPPPENFLDRPAFKGRVLNLTSGRLSDDVVRQWIDADLRRGRGDGYSFHTLRRDIADAGVFGPPGLNGTSEQIDLERAKGAVRIEGAPATETIAAAVIWVSPNEQRENPGAGYTDYVIVQLGRTTGAQSMRVLANGAREPVRRAYPPGELRWQLDTGHFVDDPVLGPLWYQKAGWSCRPDGGTSMSDICARVQP